MIKAGMPCNNSISSEVVKFMMKECTMDALLDLAIVCGIVAAVCGMLGGFKNGG